MKIAIIGANGRLGLMLCREACDRGHDVTAVIRRDNPKEKRVKKVILKNIFDLTKVDLVGYDVVLSAFGSSLDGNPDINRKAIDTMISLLSGTNTFFITVGGAGSLFNDETHTMRVYQSPEHPVFLKEISHNIYLGLEDLRESKNLQWTFVCPSLDFQYEAPRTGKYRIGNSEEVQFSKNGNSCISYADFACAMLDIAENGTYKSECITVVEE